MSEATSIVVLANSVRNQQRCVAGKEVARGLFLWKAKRWLRLLDPGTKDGEVRIENTYCAGGGNAHVLDVVEVPLGPSANDPSHPEDCFLQADVPWHRVGRLGFDDLAEFADSPASLWHDESSARTVRAGYVEAMENPATLYLVRATERCTATWWKEVQPPGSPEGEKIRRRLSARYAGQDHEFDITDPLFVRRYNMFETAHADGPRRVQLEPPLYLCVSLTRPWQGKHYKIAATIFEPPGA